jgi:hypothetical protein
MPADQPLVPGSDKPADATDQAKSGQDSDGVRPVRRWSKRVYAGLGVIVTIGGVITLGAQAGHWFSGLSQASDSTCHMATTNEIQRSPTLGISFHQSNQVAFMSYANLAKAGFQIPTIDVCLNSAPFEIWFPAFTTPNATIEICPSPTTAIFQEDPFNVSIHSSKPPGCLIKGTDVADYSYASSVLYEALPYSPSHNDISGIRVQAATGGDDKYFVASLWSPTVYTSKGPSSHAIPLSTQTANLYLVVYGTSDYNLPFTVKRLEHFVLMFR